MSAPEYTVHGRALATGRDWKIVHWRDYLDPVAVFDALGWPTGRDATGNRSR